jgi:hypothetical protein
MPKLKTDKELEAETLREAEGFKLFFRGSIDDGLYLMAVRDVLGEDIKQRIISRVFEHLENNDSEILERIRKRFLELKQNGG